MPAPVAPASPPLPRSPSTHYPPINGPGDGGGGRLALPRRGQGYWGPPGTKVPSWLPGWQEVSTAERGWKQAPHMPARGVSMVPRLSYPLGRCLRFGTESWREAGEHTPPPWATHDPPPSWALGAGPWELPAWPVPTPLCWPVGSEVMGSHAPLAHLFPRVPSPCSPHLGPSFLRQEEG